MAAIKVEKEIAGRVLSLETGRVAKQAHGAVVVQYGDTVVLATVLTAPQQQARDFFPLFVDYREMRYASGKIPGGFFKREGRPSTKEILTMRMIDRPIRPLFPKDFIDEVQIQCIVLSSDQQNDPDILAMIGAAAALTISPAPFDGPVGVARIGYADGKFVVNPTQTELASGDMDLVVATNPDGVNMIELGGAEVTEDVVAEGIALATTVGKEIVALIKDLASKVGVTKNYESTPMPEGLMEAVTSKCAARLKQAKVIHAKVERGSAIEQIQREVLAEMCPEGEEAPACTPDQVKLALYKLEGKIQRELILAGQRPDGRAIHEVRPLQMDISVLPRTHGSAIFSRGETQSLVTTTLGSPRDEQVVDGLLEEYKEKFMLHYNFPPFSVGEIRPIRGPGRRDIGHGALAEKSLKAVLPAPEDFPYTIRLVSDILESNGSTSMATVCGGTLALMDAGVPIKAPVAGISVGQVDEGGKYVLLTDIIGEEDFHGDMDFKVAGTSRGITGIQLDLKARSIAQDRIVEALTRARDARMYILEEMKKVISEPRADLSRYAPRMLTIKIDPELIGKIIGPGGKTIRKIQEDSGALIDIEDDGTVYISSAESAAAEAALAAVQSMTAVVELDKVYDGTVVSIRDFGAFIEILPGQDGLCHVSELDTKYVKNVTDVINVGDKVKVKVINIDDQGRVKLSRKAVLAESEGGSSKPAKEARGGRPRSR
jgi:polyribonucleotide nucleotidyltransferase